MICKNHERQLPFLREALEKLSNYFKKQRIFQEGQVLPLKKVHCFLNFFTSFSTASHQNRGLPLLIVKNHFETAPLHGLSSVPVETP